MQEVESMTNEQLYKIIKQIKYKNWLFHIEKREDCFVLQIRFQAPDLNYTGEIKWQHCRKWFISSHACRAEVVRTAWKAVLAAEEHEAGENFLYRGQPIHSPHLDPDAMVRIYKNEHKPFNRRKKT